MLFYTWAFIGFFCVTCLVYWQLPTLTARKVCLLIASLCFYAYWDYRFLALLLYVTLVDYRLGKAIGKAASASQRKGLLALSLTSNLGVLFFLKYVNFFIESVQQLAQALHIRLDLVTLDIILPLGISFYTLHSLSYIFDVYRRKSPVCESLLDFAVYVTFFPPLISGPIVRARDFLPQLRDQKYVADVPWKACVFLFVWGMIKKRCIADNIGAITDPVLATPDLYTNLTNLLTSFAAASQIYCDFSGYTDMAIATAGMLGLTIPVNFAWPLLSTNMADLWRRWHISLGAWFRDYVFLPLGGFHRNAAAVARNLILTMALVGLWHGAGWNFIIWGSLQGVGLSFYFLIRKWHWATAGHASDERNRLANGVLLVLGWASTFGWFCVAGAFFRERSLPLAYDYIGHNLFLKHGGYVDLGAPLAIILVVLGAAHWATYRWRPIHYVERLSTYGFFLLLAATLAVYVLTMSTNPAPFVYFEF